MTNTKRMGRPPKAAEAGTRASLGLKVTAATKAAIDERARISGRTQSQEAEWLIELALASEYVRALGEPGAGIEMQRKAARSVST